MFQTVDWYKNFKHPYGLNPLSQVYVSNMLVRGRDGCLFGLNPLSQVYVSNERKFV